MGQRYLQLSSAYTGYSENNTAILHVSQLPPNPAIFPPGPALLFVVVNGVPSVGVQVMVGNGKLGEQPINDATSLPDSQIMHPSPGNPQRNESSSGHGPENKDIIMALIIIGLGSWCM